MRLIETLLLLANGFTFLALAVSLPHAVLWIRYSALIALLVAVAQVLVEGPRWQMVPAYALAGVFFLIWLRQTIAPLSGPAHRLAVSVVAALGVFGLVVSVVLPVGLPVFRFPHPNGPYQIGTLTYHWVDANRSEIFSVDPNARRELMVQIWYPAKSDSSSPRAPYMQDADTVAPALARLLQWPEFILGHFKYVTTNAVASAPMATDQPIYPVLIFLTGLNGFRQSNNFQVEALVSHGYIVVAIDQPYAVASVVFPDGRQINGLTRNQMQPLIQQSLSPVANAPMLNDQSFTNGSIPYFAQDVSFTLDQLTLWTRLTRTIF